MRQQKLTLGDEVRLRPAHEILATLDENGTLDGLPFMPEMLAWLDKPVRVFRRVDKTCVAGHPQRQFAQDDVVVLEGARCDGSFHDHCKRSCRIYWKEAWLQPAAASDSASPQFSIGLDELRARLKIKADERRYFCQSTELLKATRAFPPQRFLGWRIALREVRNGDVSLARMLKLVWRTAWLRLRRATIGDGWLQGPNKRTPTVSLGLKAGERVRVLSRNEITKTLDAKGRNRGMGICTEMLTCCGARAEVAGRVERIVDEELGIMRDMTDTVTLKNIRNDPALAEECLCYRELGDCPRGEIMYWREAWLERIDDECR